MPLPLEPGRPGTILALLGPTNTGKTHTAVQRMLQHRTGMFGLPLRLLAREVYDRVVAQRGADQVALVTGEEKRVPPGARYWICTVESMPIDLGVAFLCVDEIQLAADRRRGHVFTDRLLRARGLTETWFLGSDTVEPLLRQLVPTVEVHRRPRLSQLRWSGHRKITSLPPRSAVVAFSVERVYALASQLRARHGGAAVVLGALSPRARNAQVAMFESGEVEYLVATDAIGMGLNMDIHHVALAGTSKFDGLERRGLSPAELAQIAGRAGRFRRDGTFGTADEAEPPAPEVIDAIEGHAFEALRSLRWRNADLDFTHVDALLASLQRPPPRRCLKMALEADDEATLKRMATSDAVRQRARGPQRTGLLWEVARIPDFGHVLPQHHATLLEQIFVRLADGDALLPDDWLAGHVDRLDRTEGDIDVLMGRIAGIRLWTYVAQRDAWLSDARAWQERTRHVEDRLSDALHTRLTARFVDHRAAALIRGPEGPAPALAPGGKVRVGSVVVGAVRGVAFEADAQLSPELKRRAQALVAPLLDERVAALVGGPDGALAIDPQGTVRWDGAPVARLVPGPDWRQPGVRLLALDGLDGPQRQRVSQRVDRWRAAWLSDREAWARALPAQTPAGRGLVHALGAGMGFVAVAEVQDLLRQLGPDRADLARAGVLFGRGFVVLPRRVEQVEERAMLWRVASGEAVELPDDTALPFEATWSAPTARRLGFVRVERWWRVDVLEAVRRGGRAEARVRGIAEAEVRRVLG